MVATPVRMVRSRSGANFELWSPGTVVPAAWALANSPGSAAPTCNITEGAPSAEPNTPKSSAPMTGSSRAVLPSPSPRRSAAPSRSVSAGSL